jgi:hypothetical protein
MMNVKPETYINRYGDLWRVEHEESDWLSTLDGFLMTYKDIGRITLNTKLSAGEKERGYSLLLDHLTTIPVGSSSVLLWDASSSPST